MVGVGVIITVGGVGIFNVKQNKLIDTNKIAVANQCKHDRYLSYHVYELIASTDHKAKI